MTTINWLHLSDLHIGAKGWQDRWNANVKGEFFGDHLKALIQQRGAIDLVFITGDLTDHCKNTEFEKLTEKLTEFANACQQEAGVAPKFVVVPGNHDFKPISVDDINRIKKMALEELYKWEEDEVVQYEFFESGNSTYEELMRELFGNYIDWCNENNSLLLPQTQQGHVLGDFSTTYEKQGFKLGIIGLNTAFLQLTAERRDIPLILDARQLDKACTQAGNFTQWSEKHHTNLLLTHHSPINLSKPSQGNLKNILPFFSIHLCGHLSEGDRVNKFRKVWQTSSFFGTSVLKNQKTLREYGYTIGKLDFTADNHKAELDLAYMKYTPLGKKQGNTVYSREDYENRNIKLNFGFKYSDSETVSTTEEIETPQPSDTETKGARDTGKKQTTNSKKDTKQAGATQTSKSQEKVKTQVNKAKRKPDTKTASDDLSKKDISTSQKETKSQVDNVNVGQATQTSVDDTPQGKAFVNEKQYDKTQQPPYSEPILPSPNFLKLIRDNVLDVRGYKPNGELTGGTGFFFAKNLLLTCYHCIGNRATGQLYDKLHITNIETEIKVSVIEKLSSQEHDYAVLFVDNPYHFKLLNTAIFTNFTKDSKTNHLTKANVVNRTKQAKFYSYGFTQLNERNLKRDKIPIIDATFISDMELPALEHPLVYAFHTRQHVLSGLSGSPICIYTPPHETKANVIAMCQGYDNLAGFADPKMYGLPMEEFSKHFVSDLDKIKTEFKTSRIYRLTKIERQSDTPYFISLLPISLHELNNLFGMQLTGINSYIAHSFADLLGYKLPTEKEWNYAIKTAQVNLKPTQKEWIIDEFEETASILASLNNNRRALEEQHPETCRENYVFRFVSEQSA